MMSNMQRVRSNRAQAAPEFVDLCKTLYGDLIDAQVIWEDVAKAGPDPADVSSHGGGAKQQVLRGTALTGAGLGGYLGVKEFAEGVRGARKAKLEKLPLPPKAKKAMLVGGALMPMDALEVGVIGSDMKRSMAARKAKKNGSLVPVHKGSVASEVMRGAHRQRTGLLQMWNGKPKVPSVKIPSAPTPAEAARTAARISATNTKATKQIAQGTDVANMLGTTSGKVLAGGVAATGAVKIKQATKKPALTYAPDGMAKSDGVVFSGTFSKFDEDKHLAFGWASVVSKGGVPVIDKQGDYISIDDLETAAYTYVVKSRVGGDNHQRTGPTAFKASDMVESIVFTDDKVEKMGLPDDFPRGWWVGFKVHDENVWSEVRKGNRTGFSIHGKGIRSEQSVDELMGYTK